MGWDRTQLSRRQVLSGLGTAAAVGAGTVGRVVADSGGDGPYLTKLGSYSFGGYGREIQREAVHTTDFLVPDLSVTPHTVETIEATGIGFGVDSTRAGVVHTEDGEPSPRGFVRIELPDIDADDYDGDIVGYRLVGDLSWGPDGSAGGTPGHPLPTRLDYVLSRYTFDGAFRGHVDVAEGCDYGGTTSWLWKRPHHRILTWLDPGYEYRLGMGSSRGIAHWELDAEIQVVVDTPRPSVGNDNGFENADDDTFERYKATSMEDIDGYSIVTRPSFTGQADAEAYVTLELSPWYGHQEPGVSCWRRQHPQGTDKTDEFGIELDPYSYRYTVTADTGVTDWHIEADVYKRVSPTSD